MLIIKIFLILLYSIISNISSKNISFREKYLNSLITAEDIKFLKKPLEPNSKKIYSSEKIKVGIIGAGFSGLYAALILDSLGIEFELIEANKKHIGGRAFTYYFSKDYKNVKDCKAYYDYADMGPMRIPTHMTRLVGEENWSLLKYLNNNKNVKNKPKLLKFIFTNNNTLFYFNGRKIYHNDLQLNDTLYFGDSHNGGQGTGIPDSYASKHYQTWIDFATKPYLKLMETNIDLAYKFIKQTDDHSARSFMSTFDAKDLLTNMGFSPNYESPIDPATNERLDRQYPQIVIDWLETLDFGTGSYDRSFSEILIDSFEFSSKDWVTIDGGISRLVDSLVEALNLSSKLSRIRMGAHVTRISKVINSDQIEVTTKNNLHLKYDHVISTLPLGVLQTVDTRSLNFDLKKRMAIRMLGYESSVKIALKFKTRWWQDPAKMNGKPIFGGQTFTDLPIRKIIYPSHGVDCKDAYGTILVSYSWSQDAIRLGSRVHSGIPSQEVSMNEDDLINDVLNQLSLIHGEVVKKEYMKKYFIMDWNDNPLSMGAYSSFGPGQFMTLYRSMIKSEVNGYMHFAGEATSVHHGWILGAINSAYRTVKEILMKENMKDKLHEFSQMWGEVDELAFFS